MNIVVLDGFTLNPGDLSWESLRRLGRCTIYDRTHADQILERAGGAEIILTNKTPLSAATISQLPNLRYIGILATGYNVVDVAAARQRGVPVCNVPAYGTSSVAQHVFALVLELTQRAGHHASSVRQGRWATNADWCYWDHPLIELDGLTLGIVGFGRIGQAVAKLGAAFGMKTIVHARRTMAGAENVTLDELFRRSDVVSLHCPLTPETKGMVNAQRLSLLKPTAFVVNTSRGGLVVEDELANALNSDRLAGAGLDVLSSEPPSATNPLLSAKNCIITPHLAWATRSARERLLATAIANVDAFLHGQAQNPVN